jgi:hypothetical protein
LFFVISVLTFGGCVALTPTTPTVHVHIGITAAGTMGDEKASHGNEQKKDDSISNTKAIEVINSGTKAAKVIINGTKKK